MSEFSIYDVPVAGRYALKATKIYRQFANPCSPTPEAWFLGYFAAAPALLWSLYGPDCQDQAYARFRKPHGSRRHTLLNISASSLPVAPPGSGIGWALFQGAEFAQRVGWYMLLADSFADWIIAGTSQAYKFSQCTEPGGAYCQMSATPGLQAGLGPGEYLYSYWHVQNQHIFSGGFSGINCPDGYNPGIGFSLNQVSGMIPELPDASWSARIVDEASGISSPWFDASPKKAGGSALTHFAMDWGFTSTFHAFRVYIQKSYGVFWIQNGTMSAYGGPKFNLGPSFCAKSALKPINPD
jgi:hypothetical protein